MKTNNFSIDLMTPGQLSKDIIFNEALLKIDSFMHCTVNDFTQSIPNQLVCGEKYIISEGEHRNKICYKPLASKSVLLHEPRIGMIVFILNGNFFLNFTNTGWEKTNISGGSQPESILDRFIPIEGTFSLPPLHTNHYLYLSDDTLISIEDNMPPEITIIIKQSDSFALRWPEHILWENRNAHIMSSSVNAIDLIKLYQLPESNHLLGKIICQNFNY